MKLVDEPCVPCRGGQGLALKDINELLSLLHGWQLTTVDDVAQLQKSVTVKNFNQAMQLAVRIGQLADKFDHHPQLIIEWGCLQIYWWTHSVSGLHKNDFILAAKSDAIIEQYLADHCSSDH